MPLAAAASLGTGCDGGQRQHKRGTGKEGGDTEVQPVPWMRGDLPPAATCRLRFGSRPGGAFSFCLL